MMFMDELSTTKKLEKVQRLRNQEGGMNESGHTFILLVNVISKMLRSILKRSCEWCEFASFGGQVQTKIDGWRILSVEA